MGIEATEVDLAEIHQDPTRPLRIPGVFEVVGLDDWVRVEVLRITSGENLLHFKLRPGSAGDDRLSPILDRFALLAPVVLGRGPHTAAFEAQWHQTEGRHIESGGLDLARQVGMAGVTPLFAGLDHGNLSGNDGPEPTRPHREHTIASAETAAGGLLFDGQYDKLDRLAQIKVLLQGLGLGPAVPDDLP